MHITPQWHPALCRPGERPTAVRVDRCLAPETLAHSGVGHL